jgi:hypothetical protein
MSLAYPETPEQRTVTSRVMSYLLSERWGEAPSKTRNLFHAVLEHDFRPLLFWRHCLGLRKHSVSTTGYPSGSGETEQLLSVEGRYSQQCVRPIFNHTGQCTRFLER